MQATAQAAEGVIAGQILGAEERMFRQLGRCLHPGCVVCIEHTAAVRPGYTPWELWGGPSCYGGDFESVCDSIERCRRAHADHHIRLSIQDLGCHSRLSFAVHRPN